MIAWVGQYLNTIDTSVIFADYLLDTPLVSPISSHGLIDVAALIQPKLTKMFLDGRSSTRTHPENSLTLLPL